jgi:hypothetical protein
MMLGGGENGLIPRVIAGVSTKEAELDPRECEDGGRRSESLSNDASGAGWACVGATFCSGTGAIALTDEELVDVKAKSLWEQTRTSTP